MIDKQSASDALDRTYTPTLIFGLAGRIGSGASFVANSLLEELKAYGYAVEKLKATELIDSEEHVLTELLNDQNNNLRFDNNELEFLRFLEERRLSPDDLSQVAKRIFIFQQNGNLLRKQFHPSYLAALSIERIQSSLPEQEDEYSHQRRKAFIIDSLKNPAEVELLRTVFGNAFYMIGVVANEAVQKRRLADQKRLTGREFDAISEIDSGQDEKHGQQATETILTADYFFENNYDKETKIKTECSRLLNLLFGSSIETPRPDEDGMHLAYMSADKSACLSRQVGSAIIGKDGTVLATGHNDVPQFGGGLYSTESRSDARCFAKSRMCHNDLEKKMLAEEVVSLLQKRLKLDPKQQKSLQLALLTESRLKNLIEFSRAVHAEMDALISVARNATPGLVGATMYVTTFPCHNCARHIIDAGIKRVVFLEPYSKSYAHKLHGDAINNPQDEPHPEKALFSNYGGIAPSRYSDWFRKRTDRKDKDGRLIARSQTKDSMLPLFPADLTTMHAQLASFSDWFMRIRGRNK